MKHKIFIIFISICLYLDSNAQYAPIPESHRYTAYIDNIIVGNEHGIYIDRIPHVLLNYYYGEYIDFSTNDSLLKTIKSKIVKKIYIEKDTVLYNNCLHIRTRKAKDGYLFVNKSIMDKIADLGFNLNELKISYVFNNGVVTTKEDVMRILRLRKKCIQIPDIVVDKQSGVITVYFIGK